jgi:alpha-aminoadipic semialdehyde synthase
MIGDPNAGSENEISLDIGKVNGCGTDDDMDKGGPKVLIFGAGRVCRPAAEFLAASPNTYTCGANDNNTCQIHVIVASLYQQDSEEVILSAAFPNF